MYQQPYHIPALLPQTIEALNPVPGGIYMDVTLGGGGHSRGLLLQLDETAHLYGLDRDEEAIANAPQDPRFTPIHGNFRYLLNFVRYYGLIGKVDGILADLGVSFHHFDDAERGFSFRADGPLDMRMNRSGGITAAQLIADAPEEWLTTIFSLYGELKNARRIARTITAARDSKPIETTSELVELVRPLISPANFKKELAQVFQALRIVVNGEMEALEALLKAAVIALRPGGRLAVITYHSLEDRMVKNFFRSGRVDGKVEKDIFGRAEVPLKPLFSKPITPDEEEVERNPRSRSAKLRVCEKL